MKNNNFYELLKGFKDFTNCMQTSNYISVPNDWAVVVTDVKGSTKAIEEGRYKHVNAIAAASIVALKNALKPVQFPFVFGGDGASACVPMSKIDSIKPALIAARDLAREEFNLELRIGIVPVEVLKKENCDLKVAKFQPYQYFSQAIFIGGGISKAEALVKDPSPNNMYILHGIDRSEASIFEGFECRWNEIPAPHEENVSILIDVIVENSDQRRDLYEEILSKIDLIYKKEVMYHPVREHLMTLTSSFKFLDVESTIRTAFMKPWQWAKYILKLQVLRFVGNYLMDNNKITSNAMEWGQYKSYFIRNSDFRKFDDMLRMIISGNEYQRKSLQEFLESYRQEGKLVYGLNVSDASQVTCIITNHNKDHIHLLDGTNGGYTLAAKMLKQQLKNLENKQLK